MPYTVLIVDDSRFFQVRLKEIVEEHKDLKVIGVAENGQEAIDMEESLRPDIISMDYEMPYVDGVTAVRTIMAKRPVPIVMFSSMTYEGAAITLQALDAGAVDFIPKNFAEVSRDSEILKKKLQDKLLTFARNAKPLANLSGLKSAPEKLVRPVKSAAKTKGKAGGKTKLVAIGASTGGPVALTDIITCLPKDFPVPIVVVQHMPENFTKVFSERLERQSEITVKEAQTGDRLEAGTVLVAPGGKQLMIERNGRSVRIVDGDERVSYKPCVDIMFASAANAFGADVLGIVLTGMGADGCEGARLLKEKGATIWGQDKDTSVVYGMPAAVAKAGLTDAVFPISKFSQQIIEQV